MINWRNWFWTVNFVKSIPNPNASNNLICPWVRRYLYMHRQNLWQTYFTWGIILLTYCGLDKQVSSCVQAIINDWAACGNSLQAIFFRIWLVINFNFCQWTMLYCRIFYRYDERICCQSHYELPILPITQWIGWKVCTNYQELVLQGRGKRSVHTDVLADGMQMHYKMDKLQMAVQKVKVSETRLHKALSWELDKRWEAMVQGSKW